MKKSTEEFVYKHITKLPWIGLAVWVAIMWAFGILPLDNYLQYFVRHFLFGLSCIVLWFILDERIATRFQRRVLLSTPCLREAAIENLLQESGVYDTESNSENDD